MTRYFTSAVLVIWSQRNQYLYLHHFLFSGNHRIAVSLQYCCPQMPFSFMLQQHGFQSCFVIFSRVHRFIHLPCHVSDKVNNAESEERLEIWRGLCSILQKPRDNNRHYKHYVHNLVWLIKHPDQLWPQISNFIAVQAGRISWQPPSLKYISKNC